MNQGIGVSLLNENGNGDNEIKAIEQFEYVLTDYEVNSPSCQIIYRRLLLFIFSIVILYIATVKILALINLFFTHVAFIHICLIGFLIGILCTLVQYFLIKMKIFYKFNVSIGHIKDQDPNIHPELIERVEYSKASSRPALSDILTLMSYAIIHILVSWSLGMMLGVKDFSIAHIMIALAAELFVFSILIVAIITLCGFLSVVFCFFNPCYQYCNPLKNCVENRIGNCLENRDRVLNNHPRFTHHLMKKNRLDDEEDNVVSFVNYELDKRNKIMRNKYNFFLISPVAYLHKSHGEYNKNHLSSRKERINCIYNEFGLNTDIKNLIHGYEGENSYKFVPRR